MIRGRRKILRHNRPHPNAINIRNTAMFFSTSIFSTIFSSILSLHVFSFTASCVDVMVVLLFCEETSELSVFLEEKEGNLIKVLSVFNFRLIPDVLSPLLSGGTFEYPCFDWLFYELFFEFSISIYR